jgi:HEAT repeat protein
MSIENQYSTQLESGLRELTKLIKAVQYYPAGHPSLKSAAQDARRAFLPLLEHEQTLICSVRKEGFFIDDWPVGPQNQILQKLAPYLFSRRIQNLTLLPDLSISDLNVFARTLAIEPAELRRQGGVKEILTRSQVTTIWVNETDLDQILAEKEKIEQSKEVQLQTLVEAGDSDPIQADKDEQRTLKKILQELRLERDVNRYRSLLFELLSAVHSNMTDAGRGEILEAYAQLCQHASTRALTHELREAAHQMLVQLTDPIMLDYLVDTLCLKTLSDKGRSLLKRILIYLHSISIDHLMNRLTREDNAHKRRILVEALVEQGAKVLPTIAEYLQDDRWFVVRNAVSIIGDIRNPGGAQYLTPLLHHADIRVCRETIRSLTRIGGPDAAKLLLAAVEDKDQEISRQALLSLGVVKDSSAVPVLVRIVQSGDFFMKQAGKKKDALHALGEIGSAEALPALIELVKKRRVFYHKKSDELRALAAQALGDIGHPDAIPVLEAVFKSASGNVARQANAALRQLSRQRDQHGNGST